MEVGRLNGGCGQEALVCCVKVRVQAIQFIFVLLAEFGMLCLEVVERLSDEVEFVHLGCDWLQKWLVTEGVALIWNG